MKYFLGVDGGGTKTEAVLIDQNNKVVGSGRADGILVSVYGWREAVNNLYLAINWWSYHIILVVAFCNN